VYTGRLARNPEKAKQLEDLQARLAKNSEDLHRALLLETALAAEKLSREMETLRADLICDSLVRIDMGILARPRCTDGAHATTLASIKAWAVSPLHDGKNVLWLRGPAGCGKTAVITTLIEELSDAHHLGGNFFFEKDKDRDPSFLIQTLVAQLASSDKPLMRGIAGRIRANRSVLQGSLEDQFEELLLRPLLAHAPNRPVVFLVDGLEWCGKGQEGGERDILKKVLRLLVEGSARFPPNVRLLFSGEEDESVREFLGGCDRVVEFEMAEAEAAGPLSVSSA
jgi:hypothetical protein